MRIATGSNQGGEYQRPDDGTHAGDNPLLALPGLGQSLWLDYIRRGLLTGGELERLIAEDDLRGVTTNPAIFEKALAASTDYRELLSSPEAQGLDAKALYELLAIRDVRDAADLLRNVYVETGRRDGYVSLEVSPFLAYDTAGTVSEAHRLWKEIDRPNVMMKVPATPEGIAAIRELIAAGINVNATLLFSVDVYTEVAEAYMTGLEQLIANGGDPGGAASVASFFVSRIDTAVDEALEERLQRHPDPAVRQRVRALAGKVAVANAKLAYQRYLELVSGARWQSLAAHGAQTQRLLWASTGVKNPQYRDVLYVEELIGADTVNTIPPATLEAFRDHGRPRASLGGDVGSAHETLRALAAMDVSLAQVAQRLLADGVQIFSDAFVKLLDAVDKQEREARGGSLGRLTYKLSSSIASAVDASLAEWRSADNVRRLWARDASLWTGKDEGRWLGWLGITNDQLAHAERFGRIAEVAKTAGFRDALLLGMGGSSLGPDVLRATFGRIPGFPALHVLDSTDPAQIKTIEQRVDLASTLFIVSSKSGSTLEPDVLKGYFFDRVRQLVGPEEAGRRFVAITDPGSNLQRAAETDNFRRVFFGWPDIGGRYSALSDFGLVPAAIMGVDVGKLLERAEAMVWSCMPSVPLAENPGVLLGTIIGVAARDFRRDKLTIVASPQVAVFGAWLEQLVAESTGKDGRGVIPVDREKLTTPELYGPDRIFAYVRLAAAPDHEQDRLVGELERAGHPVLRISLDDVYDLGAEFFRWEIATAVAGAVLGVHPFDQPDVEASKTATRKLTAAYEQTGTVPAEEPIWREAGIELYTDGRNAAELSGAMRRTPTLAGYLRAHFDRLEAGDYCALLAYIEMSDVHERVLQTVRERVRDAKRVATCLEFGPRFLHSTGQAYKGGPNTGVFLQITCEDAFDVPVPGRTYTFGVVKAMQARGDLEVLFARRRRALRIHLTRDIEAALAELDAAVATALRQ